MSRFFHPIEQKFDRKIDKNFIPKIDKNLVLKVKHFKVKNLLGLLLKFRKLLHH